MYITGWLIFLEASNISKGFLQLLKVLYGPRIKSLKLQSILLTLDKAAVNQSSNGW